jgi:hypothetical protein
MPYLKYKPATHLTKELDSYHSPVIVALGSHTEKNATNFYNYKKAEWGKYKADINNNLMDQHIHESELTIELAAMQLKRKIINAANKYIPVNNVKYKTPNIPSEVHDLNNERNSLFRIKQKL